MHKIGLYIALTFLALPVWARLDVYVVATQGPAAAYLPDLATRLTGAAPAMHGICADSVFSRTTRRPEPILNGTCADLLMPTCTDSLRLRSPQSAVYAIGLNAPTTCLMAGHAATTCCWLQRADTTMQWATSSYYMGGLPSTAVRMNKTMPSADTDNSRVAALALALQQDFYLGMSVGITDVLLLQLDATDAALPSLMTVLRDTLTNRMGSEPMRWTVWNADNGLGEYAPQVVSADADVFHLTRQPFSTDRAMALTSAYLVALYGNQRWLDGAYRNALYLNRDVLEQQRMSIVTVRQQVAEFLMRFEGVRYACPASEAYLIADFAPSVHKRFVGDVVFFLQPNYTLVP